MKDTSFDLFAPNVTDGYKVGHRPLYPEGTDFAYINGTFRSDRLFLDNKSTSRFWDSKVVWVGMQGALREINGLWKRSFFDKPKDVVCRRYARRMNAYLGAGRVNVECFEKLHDLGYLPISVLAIKEGSRVNMNVPVYTMYNTIPEFYWIVNYLETLMSSIVWKMTTNATIAYEYRRTLEYWAGLTGVDKSFVDIQGHDFAFRGLSGPEDAARTGFGHLVCFKGTDTIPAIDYAEDMYFANVETEFVACSVVATEHAVATANILFNVSKLLKQIAADKDEGVLEDEFTPDLAELRAKGELQFIREILTEKHPTGVVSLVSDSFDFWKVITELASELKDVIINRLPDVLGLAKTVFRPDSGDPVEVICGKEIFDSEDLVTYQERKQYANKRKAVLAINDAVDVTKKPFGENVQLEEDMVIVTHGGATFRAYSEKKFSRPANATIQIPGYWMVPLAAEPLTPEEKGAVECLWDIFNGTHTPAGYRVLHERVGLIYGDSITVQRADEILRRLAKKNFASSCIVFGVGSYTYQMNSRDTFGFAIKATAVGIRHDVVELFKAPKTEKDTLKKSAKGFLKVVKTADGDFMLEQEQEMSINDLATSSGELRQVYLDSEFILETSLKEITAVLFETA